MLRVPGIAGNAKGRGLGGASHGELVHVGLADHNHSSFFQIQNCLCRIGRLKVIQDFGRAGGLKTLCAHVVLDGNGNACQRTGQFTVVDVLLHLFCSFQSSFFVHGDKAIQNLILFFYLSQGCFHSVHGCHFSGLDLLSNFRCCHFTKFHSLSPPTLRSSVPYTYRP